MSLTPPRYCIWVSHFWHKLVVMLQYVKHGVRAHGPLLSLFAGKETWGGPSDSYFQNIRNYSMLIQNEAAKDMVEASNMAALGVEVQGASIRWAKRRCTSLCQHGMRNGPSTPCCALAFTRAAG